jgi:methylenetetrahydrofolate dehydrogenase (NADP+)/methenyltetrahydrofolate cyclohydrolase
MGRDATVTVCHSKTKDLPGVCREAEVLIACAGKAKMLDARYVRPGAVVIDVGINIGKDGKLCGDVDYASAETQAAAITPVPGGVGMVTTSVLAKQLIKAAKANARGAETES